MLPLHARYDFHLPGDHHYINAITGEQSKPEFYFENLFFFVFFFFFKNQPKSYINQENEKLL